MQCFWLLETVRGKGKNTPINECKSYLSISCLFDLLTRQLVNRYISTKAEKNWLVWKCAGTLTDNNEWNAWQKIATDFEKRQAAYDSYNKSDFIIHLR